MGEASSPTTVIDFGSPLRRRVFDLSSVLKLSLSLLSLLLMVIAIQAQATAHNESDTYVIEGTSESNAYGLGRSIRINGTVKEGAIALGGDVIVQGVVEGDVAAFGGSVIQLDGARIGGDVIVVGGTYRHEKTASRNPSSATIMYAGYEEELRNLMRNPSDLLKPNLSPGYIGMRLLAVLFWFVISLALTAAMPNTISRGIARLQLTSLRVAVIGVLGVATIAIGVPVSLRYLPTPIGVLVGLMALLLILVAWLFGRVMIHAATGRWLQRRFLPIGKGSESVALLIGTAFWIALSSLPYVWPFVVAVMFVISLGLALTAKYHVGWRKLAKGQTQEIRRQKAA